MLANNGVLVEDFVELAEFKEEDFVIVGLFNFPVLGHAWSECLPLILRNVKSRGVVVGVVRPPALAVADFFFLQKFGSGIQDVFYRRKPASNVYIFLVYYRTFFLHFTHSLLGFGRLSCRQLCCVSFFDLGSDLTSFLLGHFLDRLLGVLIITVHQNLLSPA